MVSERTRLKTRDNALYETLELDTSDSEVDFGNNSVSKRKARKATKRRKKSNHKSSIAPAARKVSTSSNGVLSSLLTFPLDVLYEIFGQLTMNDLIHLSRTSKLFRKTLLSKTSKSVWAQCFAGLNPPPPPKPQDLNEVQYACLLFDKICHYCSKSFKSGHGFYEARRQCCKKCLGDKKLIPQSLIINYLKPEERNIWNILAPIVPGTPLERGGNRRRYIEAHFSMDIVTDLMKEYNCLPNEEYRVQWISTKLIEKVERQSHSTDCRTWSVNYAAAREQEIEDLKDDRQDDIFQRLYDEGWADAIDNLTTYQIIEFGHHKSVRLPMPLTDEGWKRIRKDMHLLIEEVIE